MESGLIGLDIAKLGQLFEYRDAKRQQLADTVRIVPARSPLFAAMEEVVGGDMICASLRRPIPAFIGSDGILSARPGRGTDIA
ncbi:hypothetical protein ASE70_10215 [Sphingomonas sp. Leaf22]|uniref:hypothetical protein n=1 Tax=Sphingomonas sp. Leaf22 TaxID=1735687 RepID=UPI0007015D04|nr:hypothetical protein [Sphingomonas sp. Leaf22]KQM76160.1 hypothetical protein ASE70_10215 [Sphingomonas sp. Leaf22]